VSDPLDPALEGELLCYCTGLTFAAFRDAWARGAWPPVGKERTGKLCTGCLGDLLHLQRALGTPGAAGDRQVDTGTGASI
jgi:hypothetical protein